MNNSSNNFMTNIAQAVTRQGALKNLGVGLVGIGLTCFGIPPSPVASPVFNAIDYPGASDTFATDINASGRICGVFFDSSGVNGFILSQGNLSPIRVPGSAFTAALGINRNGDVVGMYSPTNPDPSGGKDIHGFLLRDGAFTSIDVPGAAWTRAIGINRAGDIVGTWAEVNRGKQHGFVLSGGIFTTIDFPDSDCTGTWKINDSGEIAGRYQTGGDSKFHLFLLADGVFTSIEDYPGAAQMAPTAACAFHGGLNNSGDIVAAYMDASGNLTLSRNNNANTLERTHGLLLSEGVFTPIDFPGANCTVAWGISDKGVIVGAYLDSAGTFHGFSRNP